VRRRKACPRLAVSRNDDLLPVSDQVEQPPSLFLASRAPTSRMLPPKVLAYASLNGAQVKPFETPVGYPFSSRLSSLRKRQSVVSAIIFLGSALIMPASYSLSA